MSRDSASCDCSRHRVCARCLERAKKERDEALHAEDVAERYREDAVAERDRLVGLEDGYLADIATLNARIKRLAEALRLLLDGPDPHGGETERIARSALASMEGEKAEFPENFE
jgi:hypothetical protein